MSCFSHTPLSSPPAASAADPELEFAIVIALYEPQRLMIPVLLRIRHQPRADLVKGVHITGAPYSTRQVMKGNCFGAISFDKVPVAAADVMSAFVSVDAAASPSSRFILAKGALSKSPNLPHLVHQTSYQCCERRHPRCVSRPPAESSHRRPSPVPCRRHGTNSNHPLPPQCTLPSHAPHSAAC